ncbi:TetR/AcrR family transcriptional regulator [Lacticaseibacillus porcinae]|uniref:TetR/AcrR family transcriptional regulator n=1 Tax=Lacticaseibacillus porcinae TaxID=1123687 RepID=UPI0013DE2161|nr:TetR/AcrR family transcriptional regulator [Lacticaseibacillus porcinae]
MTQHNSQRREQIIKTAQELFAEQGFANTTTRQLNQTVGIADGLLYYYFPQGKQALLDTIVATGISDRLNMIRMQLQGVDTLDGLEQAMMQAFEKVWAVLSAPEGYQVFVITVRERHLLSQKASAWLDQSALKFVQTMSAQLATLPWLHLDVTNAAQLASIVIDLLRNSLASDLLFADRQHISEATKIRVQGQLHYLLQQLH